MKSVVVSAALALALVAAWMLRWDIEQTGERDGASVYALDRLTGSIYLIAGARRFEVAPFTKPAAKQMRADEFLDAPATKQDSR